MLQALKDYVIVKPVYQEKVGSIIIPFAPKQSSKDTRRGKYQLYDGFIYGIVESVGSLYKQTYGGGKTLQPGDKIIWQRHEGLRFYYDGEEYLKLKAKWVMGVMDAN